MHNYVPTEMMLPHVLIITQHNSNKQRPPTKTNNDGVSIVPSRPSMGNTVIRVVVRRRFPPLDGRVVGDGDDDDGGRTTISRGGGRRRRIIERRSLSAVPGAVDDP